MHLFDATSNFIALSVTCLIVSRLQAHKSGNDVWKRNEGLKSVKRSLLSVQNLSIVVLHLFDATSNLIALPAYLIVSYLL